VNVDTSSAAPAAPTDALPDVRLLIDGHWIASADRQQLIVTNPANKAAIGTVPIATDGDIEAALRASDRAYPQWRDTSPYERAEIIQRAATLLRERAETIAHAMTLENGKPYWDSLGEVRYTADIMDSMATDGPRRFGHVLPAGAADGRTILVSEPVGPVAAFSPWNYPLTVPGRKLAAAFSAGCTVIIKPAEETPSSAVALAEAFVDAGLPAGVLGLLFGDPAQISSALIASPVIRKVSFTGSTGVGKHIAQLAGSHVKREASHARAGWARAGHRLRRRRRRRRRAAGRRSQGTQHRAVLRVPEPLLRPRARL
jgi:succinate-semialdehyde dehydrogenase/glutarate-semialdehyde dehydrogenase